mgnify:CR=1 FL=1
MVLKQQIMATNLVSTTVYKLNQRPPIALTETYLVGFPTQGCLIKSCFGSPTRDLGNGISVYAEITVPSGDKYYVQQTIAQIVTLFNA